MEDLQELVEVFRSKKILKYIRVSGPKRTKLYQGLVNNKYKSEKDALLDIYGNLSDQGKFAVLQSDLKKILLDAFFTIDLKHLPSKQLRLHFKTLRNHYLSASLTSFASRDLSAAIGKKVVKDSQMLQIQPLQLMPLHEQMKQTAYFGKKRQLDQQYNELINIIDLYRAEIQVEFLHLNLLEFIGFTSLSPNVRNKAKEYYKTASLIRKKKRSFYIDYDFYCIACIYFEMNHQYLHFLRTCNEAIQCISTYASRKGTQFEARFRTYKIEACLYLGNYELAQEEVEICKKILWSGNNRFTIAAYEYLLYTHTKQFGKAREVVDATISNSFYKLQPPYRKERWLLYTLCLDISDTLNNISSSTRNVDLEKTVKQLGHFTKDKSGVNGILILFRFLLLLTDKRYDLITNQIETVKSHYQRYIKGSSPSLASIFKLLIMMERRSFSYKNIISDAEKLKTKHNLKGITSSELNEGIAILPYDWLFDKTLEILKRNNEKDAARGRRLK